VAASHERRACRHAVALDVEVEEAQAFTWLPLAEALKLDLNIPTRVLIDECIRRGLLR